MLAACSQPVYGVVHGAGSLFEVQRVGLQQTAVAKSYILVHGLREREIKNLMSCLCSSRSKGRKLIANRMERNLFTKLSADYRCSYKILLSL